LAKKNSNDSLLPDGISRRDFVNGTLVGFGTALLTSSIPAIASSKVKTGVFNDPWTGYGGIGDYANSNGNVAAVREAAHLIRDGLTPQLMENVEDTGEEYDMVIIGGGFSGIGAAYQFHKKYGD
jgi:spermidine dehydrogenase